MNCPHEHDFETAERYVSGALPEPEQAAFEAHFFSCERCFADVQALQEVWQSLRKEGRPAGAVAGSAPATQAPRASWSMWTWGALAAAALVALAVASSSFWQRAAPEPAPRLATGAPSSSVPGATPSSPPGSQPGASTPRPETPTPDRAALLQQLAVVVAPPYVGLATRGSHASDAEFDRAMTHYTAGRYAEAATGLRTIVTSETTGGVPTRLARAQFFLGICSLMQGSPAAARDELTSAAGSGVAPYADEAHFYLAKAALGSGDADTARRELTIAASREAGPDGEAARLLARLR